MAAKRKPYESPVVAEVKLAPDQAVLAICKSLGTGNWYDAKWAVLNTCYAPDAALWCREAGN